MTDTHQVPLTDREIDHILISLECSIAGLTNIVDESLRRGVPTSGVEGSIQRFRDLHAGILNIAGREPDPTSMQPIAMKCMWSLTEKDDETD